VTIIEKIIDILLFLITFDQIWHTSLRNSTVFHHDVHRLDELTVIDLHHHDFLGFHFNDSVANDFTYPECMHY